MTVPLPPRGDPSWTRWVVYTGWGPGHDLDHGYGPYSWSVAVGYVATLKAQLTASAAAGGRSDWHVYALPCDTYPTPPS